jgi:hypothetical protein
MEQLTQFVSKSFEPGRCTGSRNAGDAEDVSRHTASHPEWGTSAPSAVTSGPRKRQSPLSPCPDTSGAEASRSRGPSVSPVVDPDDSRSSPSSSGNPLLLNSPRTEPRSPEPGPEEGHGVLNAAGSKAVMIVREDSKSGKSLGLLGSELCSIELRLNWKSQFEKQSKLAQKQSAGPEWPGFCSNAKEVHDK